MSCECPLAGWCQRHGVKKTARERDLCAGVNCHLDQHVRYWRAWEEGRMPGQTGPPADADPNGFKRHIEKVNKPSKTGRTAVVEHKRTVNRTSIRHADYSHLDCIHRGSVVRTAICDLCGARGAPVEVYACALHGECTKGAKGRQLRDRSRPAICLTCPDITPPSESQIQRIPFSGEPVRNLLYHVYPRRGNGAWQWNIDQLRAYLPLFTGRKIVAIAMDSTTDHAEDVERYFGEGIEFIRVANDKLGELNSHLALVGLLETDDPQQVTFRAHAKTVSYKHNEKPHLYQWTHMLYEMLLGDWSAVRSMLETHAMAGVLRKHGTPGGKHRWMYCGSFYWFRNLHVYRREWRTVDRVRWAAESWPGHLFRSTEVGCLALDNCQQPYSAPYFAKTIWPAFQAWLKEHGKTVRYQPPVRT